MSNYSIILSIVSLILLILLSAFFSAAETAIMTSNRYRLRHRARLKKKAASLILKLLNRPDRVLGMILIGNCFANIFASAIMTILTLNFFGGHNVLLASLLLTFFILIFAEVAPKTVAALYPENLAYIVAWPVYILLKLFYPLVWFINTISNGILRLLGVKVGLLSSEPLGREELRSIVYEATGKMARQYQHMLLGILDLNKITVADVMIPQHEIVGIDLAEDWGAVVQQIVTNQFDWLPVYRESINKVVGILHVRDIAKTILSKSFNQESLIRMLSESYFIPESTPLNVQLAHFQQQRKRIAFVVDEYGDILGLVTLKDILEEIVGEFTSSVDINVKMIHKRSDGSYLADGTVTIRELNRATHWQLPIDGPRTLSGLIIEYLEAIPRAGTCVKIADHPIEIMRVEENRIIVARIYAKPDQ